MHAVGRGTDPTAVVALPAGSRQSFLCNGFDAGDES